MKKTYTACFLLVLSSVFYYGTLTGSGDLTCEKGRGLTGVNNNPTTCSTSNCHGSSVAIDSSMLDPSRGPGLGPGPSGIADIVFKEGLSAYPTVATSILQIVSTKASKSLAYNIYSLDGRLMLSDALPSFPSLTFVDVRGLAPAQYVVRVADAEHSASFRIIKQ